MSKVLPKDLRLWDEIRLVKRNLATHYQLYVLHEYTFLIFVAFCCRRQIR
ncbi:MAG: hypothetical protein HC908_14935 [Calothrix sp. SM1_7_51]|nr:hypothetical protein [Calothrix sp. SM1_7_51]